MFFLDHILTSSSIYLRQRPQTCEAAVQTWTPVETDDSRPQSTPVQTRNQITRRPRPSFYDHHNQIETLFGRLETARRTLKEKTELLESLSMDLFREDTLGHLNKRVNHLQKELDFLKASPVETDSFNHNLGEDLSKRLQSLDISSDEFQEVNRTIDSLVDLMQELKHRNRSQEQQTIPPIEQKFKQIEEETKQWISSLEDSVKAQLHKTPYFIQNSFSRGSSREWES